MSPKTKLHIVVLLISLVFFAPNTMAQKGSKKGNDPGKTVGVSVSPSHFHFSQKQGEVKTYDITIRNSTSTPKEFNINIYDFDMNGKTKFDNPDDDRNALLIQVVLYPQNAENLTNFAHLIEQLP